MKDVFLRSINYLVSGQSSNTNNKSSVYMITQRIIQSGLFHLKNSVAVAATILSLGTSGPTSRLPVYTVFLFWE